MPAGLDGARDPVRSRARDLVLDAAADAVERHPGPRRSVGVDGRSGSGKSTFADELAARLRARGHAVLRSTTDSFHRPRAERMRLGETSGQGFYEDSHQLEVMRRELLDPFATGRHRVRTAAFDEPSDTPMDVVEDVPAEAVLVVDGLFLHRREQAGCWGRSILLLADRRLDATWLGYLLDDLPADPSERSAEVDARLHRARWPRYRDGWRCYLDAVDPEAAATLVVDNEEIAAPQVLVQR